MNSYTHASLTTSDGRSVMLNSVHVSGDLRGALFEARVEQKYYNPTDTNVEVVYSFPLPWGALLLGVDVTLGAHRLSGVVVEKTHAEARYEDALVEGDTAVILEKNAEGSYSLSLGNLNAGESCQITLRYAQTLSFEQGGLRVLIPTVIAPRYGDPISDGGLRPHQTTRHDLLVDYPFKIALRLHGDLRQARIASPSHPIQVAPARQDSPEPVTITLARDSTLDRDFVLVLDQLTQPSMAVVARDVVDTDHIVALLSFCPQVPELEAKPLAVKMLVDCSGSMAGDSVEAARRALHSIIEQLRENDRFSLSRFGSTVEHRSRGLWRTKDSTRQAAHRWVDGVHADLGGTEMNGALISTFALGGRESSDVLLVTDGQIEAVDRTIDSAKAAGQRVFVVGIGSSPAESHLRRLAEMTGGACDFVAPGEAVEPAVLRMFSRLHSSRLTDLSLRWPDGVEPVWTSPLNQALFDGDTFQVFGTFKAEFDGKVRLFAHRAGESCPEEIACVLVDGGVTPETALPKLVAERRLQALLGDGSSSRADAATELAVAYQLISEHTSFLLVHLRADEDKPTDMPELHQVSQMIPAGWGGLGSVTVKPPRRAREYVSQDVATDSIPAVLRRGRRATDPSMRSGHRYDIPAFLRDSEEPVERSDPRYWTRSFEYTGLTPLGLHVWLNKTPEKAWPKTYVGLQDAGVGPWVVEWLELMIAEPQALPEALVVAAFLAAMASADIKPRLALDENLVQSLKEMPGRLKSLFAGHSMSNRKYVDSRLAQEILEALDGIVAEDWPEQVFALEAK